MERKDEIRLLTEYLLKLLNEEKNNNVKSTHTSKNIELSKAELAARKTMRQLNEMYGVEIDVINAIIKKANQLKKERTDYIVSKPLWEEYGDLNDNI